MIEPAHAEPRYTVERYLALVEAGVLGPDDRVELLEGVIVAMSPQNPPHAAAVGRVDDALREAVGKRAVVSVQAPLRCCRVSGPTTTTHIRRAPCWWWRSPTPPSCKTG